MIRSKSDVFWLFRWSQSDATVLDVMDVAELADERVAEDPRGTEATAVHVEQRQVAFRRVRLEGRN